MLIESCIGGIEPENKGLTIYCQIGFMIKGGNCGF